MSTFHVIDDEDNILTILEGMISCFGYHSKLFTSADAYLKHMESPGYEAPVAVLTDNVMPGMGGHELIDNIHCTVPTQKVAMISGTPDGRIADNDEVCFTLQKPFRMNDLKRLLDTLVKCDNESGACNYEAVCKFGLDHGCPRHARGG